MFNGKYVSSSYLMNELYRDFKSFDYQLQVGDVVQWIGDGLRRLKMPRYYVDKLTDGNLDLNHLPFIEIVDGRGELPYDMISITQTAAVIEQSNPFNPTYVLSGIVYTDLETGQSCTLGDGSSLCNQFTDCNCQPNSDQKHDKCCTAACKKYALMPMRWNTHTFFKGYHNCDLDVRANSNLTYTVNGNYIFTSFKTGKVCMAYRAVPLDEDGLPLIPDTQSVIEYLKWFCAEKIAFNLFLTDKYTENKLAYFQANQQLFFKKARAEAKLPQSLDEWESVKNERIKMLPRFFEHDNFFGRLQAPQLIWNQPRSVALNNPTSRIL